MVIWAMCGNNGQVKAQLATMLSEKMQQIMTQVMILPQHPPISI